jgi:hypothetical protein
MKIELQKTTDAGKKVCPISKREFTDAGPYSFIITEGKFKGETMDPEIAIKRDFAISDEAYRQIQKDYILARQREGLFCWDRNQNKQVIELLRRTGIDLPHPTVPRFFSPAPGKTIKDPQQLREISQVQANINEIIKCLEGEDYTGYVNKNSLKWSQDRARRMGRFLITKQIELTTEMRLSADENYINGIRKLQDDLLEVIKYFEDQVN